MHTVSEACYNYYHKSWDPRWGGFGDAPKFPQPANLEFLLHYHKRDVNGQLNKRALTMLDKTLTRMAMGGIYDHVMQGFHRYSTDGRWHVPHFEKMLYDQAQLAVIYADTFDVTNNQLFEDILKGILTYVDRDLSHPLGGFYSAEDADSLPTAEDKEKREGAFCVWSWEELQTLLSATVPDSEKKLVDVFVHYYNCKIVGNTNPDLDPHGELIGQNVLIVYEEAEKTADELDLTTKQVTDALKQSRKILAEKRLTRPPPHLDTKIMTAWNGLMISGFAKASSVLAGKGKPDISAKYRQRASKAAEFLQKFSAGENGRLLRCVYATKRGDQEVHQIENPVLGFADDYAFLIQGILDLIECSETSDKDRWLKWALQLQRQMDELFWDEANDATYYLNTDDDESILIRLKDDHDGAEPCINSVATHNLIRLSRHLKESDPALSKSMVHKCRRIFLAFEQRLNKTPFVVPKMVCALVDFEQVKSVE